MDTVCRGYVRGKRSSPWALHITLFNSVLCKLMSLIKAVLSKKCPRCQKGKIYGKVNLLQYGKMNTSCPHCDLRFDREPGYFTGAMYVSYGMAVGQAILTFALCQPFLDSAFDPIVIPFVVGVLILMAGFNFTYSRVLWLYMFTPKVKD